VSKIRVLRLISRLNVGGPAHHVLILTKYLPEDRYETLLVAGQEPKGELRADAWATRYGVSVHYLTALQRTPNLWRDIQAAWQLYRLLRQYKPHILHTHTAKAGALGRLVGWFARVPIRIHTYHGHSLTGYFPKPLSWLYQKIERLLAKLSHQLITISPRLLEELTDQFRIAPKEKFFVIPLGFDMARWRRYDAAQVTRLRAQWAPQGEILLGWVGRLVPIKQVGKLLEAAAPLIKAGYPLKLVLIGEGPEKPTLQKQADALGMGPACIWAGARQDMPEVYRALDALALPSRNEGTPVVLIEALACGIPVIASAVGGIPDVLQNGQWGYLVPPEASWTEPLSTFLQDLPLWRSKAQAAQPHILTHYDYQRLVNDITTLYSSFDPREC
jgi:glycosyltransferase involved in cell wall biosynthesis